MIDRIRNDDMEQLPEFVKGEIKELIMKMLN
jgi:hypothetical protein